MPNAPTTSVKLDTDLKVRLQRLADTRRRSQHWLMCEAIEQYVVREEQRQQLRDDALSAWAEYQETGLHLTGAEMDAWMARIEAGEDADPPPPHE
ncbi:MAG TPA: ribbon-helix-helix protein, CopG family [Stellaceae bacterium]|jgi:predicted transcriptional regulator|nr:ribbon-helix-helix protein, CopG family [Stellaceae bacterium]